ncbi:MAG: hypothetical protein ACQEXQ_03570 [Bacillota bacterium]
MNFEEGLIQIQDFIRKRPIVIVGTGQTSGDKVNLMQGVENLRKQSRT